MPKTRRIFGRTLPALAGLGLLWTSLNLSFGDSPTTSPTTTAATAIAFSSTTLPTTAPAVTKIDGLINQLGSDDSDQRNAAQNELVACGSPAIPALKKAAENSDDPEIRSRAAAALSQLRDQEFNGPSLITLHMKDMSLTDVLLAIGKQSHLNFAQLPRAPVVSLDVDRKPFWEVMANVCTQAGVCPLPGDLNGRNTMRLFPGGRNWMTDSPHQIVGAFWISVAGVYRSRSIDLLGPPRVDDAFSIRFLVMPEPKLAITHLSEFKVKEAVDDAGHSLMPRVGRLPAGFRMLGGGPVSRQIETQLTFPENPGKKIAVLRGEFSAMIAENVQQFQLDDVLGTPKPTNPLTGCRIQATLLRQGTDIYRVTLQCTRTGMTDEQWSALVNHVNDLTLMDADGTPLNGLQMNTTVASNAGNTSFTTTSIFTRSPAGMMAFNPAGLPTRPGLPSKLTWNLSTSEKPLAIPVTFKDLPMP